MAVLAGAMVLLQPALQGLGNLKLVVFFVVGLAIVAAVPWISTGFLG